MATVEEELRSKVLELAQEVDALPALLKKRVNTALSSCNDHCSTNDDALRVKVKTLERQLRLAQSLVGERCEKFENRLQVVREGIDEYATQPHTLTVVAKITKMAGLFPQHLDHRMEQDMLKMESELALLKQKLERKKESKRKRDMTPAEHSTWIAEQAEAKLQRDAEREEIREHIENKEKRAREEKKTEEEAAKQSKKQQVQAERELQQQREKQKREEEQQICQPVRDAVERFRRDFFRLTRGNKDATLAAPIKIEWRLLSLADKLTCTEAQDDQMDIASMKEQMQLLLITEGEDVSKQFAQVLLDSTNDIQRVRQALKALKLAVRFRNEEFMRAWLQNRSQQWEIDLIAVVAVMTAQKKSFELCNLDDENSLNGALDALQFKNFCCDLTYAERFLRHVSDEDAKATLSSLISQQKSGTEPPDMRALRQFVLKQRLLKLQGILPRLTSGRDHYTFHNGKLISSYFNFPPYEF